MQNSYGDQKEWMKDLYRKGVEELQKDDEYLYSILTNEHDRQQNELMMVASCSIVPPSVLACLGSQVVNVTAEGYPGARYHAGCKEIDKIENLAIERAKNIFKAKYANVQPHSASTANEIVLYSLLEHGDTILGMSLASGGHLSHGANVSFSGKSFHSEKYFLGSDYQIDYDAVERKAIECKPKLIICGTTAYPRKVDFRRFRQIADKVGAYLLADISHIAGLVVAGEHESPIDYAHITTTCTHKQLAGPRGGLIMCGKDYDMKLKDGKNLTLAQHFDKAVFPFFQGAPKLNMIAAKARAFDIAQTDSFKDQMKRVRVTAEKLAKYFKDLGYDVISGGTETHLLLIDLSSRNIPGDIAEKALEECGIIVNRNSIPNIRKDSKSPLGIRLGTNSLAQRGFKEKDMGECARIIDMVFSEITITNDEYKINISAKKKIKDSIQNLCAKYPVPYY